MSDEENYELKDKIENTIKISDERRIIIDNEVMDTSKTFSELGLDKTLCQTLNKINYTYPTKIQVETIPIAIEGKDIIGISQTGSGKTAACKIIFYKI
jgi:ATP-dependent RNA helicase DDX47/RRP3